MNKTPRINQNSMSDSDDQNNISLDQLGSSPEQLASSPDYKRSRLISLNKVKLSFLLFHYPYQPWVLRVGHELQRFTLFLKN